jgi:hypothetical protein
MISKVTKAQKKEKWLDFCIALLSFISWGSSPVKDAARSLCASAREGVLAVR